MAWFRADARTPPALPPALPPSMPPSAPAWGQPLAAAATPVLVVDALDVYYGRAHALQGVSLTLERGVLGIVGRNGMGKSTLCNALTGLVPARGSVRLHGQELLGLAPHQITRRGIAYVPQGRRVWASLTVDETLRLVARQRREVDRVYAMFPRLAERRSHGGAQLSGGEQQMLAIGRALLLEPRLLVMDEPTEGLAPVIVLQLSQALRELSTQIAVLLIEQNLGVALAVADRVAVMVNGRIANDMPAATLAADRSLQERLLGVRAAAEDDDDDGAAPTPPAASAPMPQQVLTVQRAHGGGVGASALAADVAARPGAINRWSVASGPAPLAAAATPATPAAGTVRPAAESARVLSFPVAASGSRAAYVVGTFDTKARELLYLRQCLEKLGLRVVSIDLSTSGKPSSASVHPREVARQHPQGEAVVFSGDRGSAISAMALAFERYLLTRHDVGGIISAGGSGGTTLASAGMRALPIGCPKVMVSTMASGDTRPYVGSSDICMLYPVTDVQGIHRISAQVLGNAAHALAGMMAHPVAVPERSKPALGLTMFGVTTPCVQALAQRLEPSYDCLIFHATGVGGQSLEKLVDSGLLEGVIDVSTTEVADEIGGGVFSAGPTRMDVYARHALPYVGSCGALDMVNFGAWDSVPERFKRRVLYRHNPNVTLMRTTPDECRAIAEFIAAKLNAFAGPLRFLIPEGGVSAIDMPGQPFHDPAANRVLFDTLAQRFRPGPQRRLIRLPLHINDPAFADALVAAWHEIAPATNPHSHAAHRQTRLA